MRLAVEGFVGDEEVLQGKGGLRAGVVELCSNGSYSVVCGDESWDEREASVVCRQLGFSPFGATVTQDFHVISAPSLHSVECTGSEPSLLGCSYSSAPPSPCGPNQHAGVVCQRTSLPPLLPLTSLPSSLSPPSPPPTHTHTHTALSTPEAEGGCSSGEVRIASQDPPDAGRVEVCVNNAWGTICNDDLFGSPEAMVLCYQLGGYQREGIHVCAHSTLPPSLPPSQKPPPTMLLQA